MNIESGYDLIGVFETLQTILPIISDDSISFSIADRDCFLKSYDSPGLCFNVPEGTRIPEGSTVKQVIEINKMIVREVPEQVYGTPFKSYAIPVFDATGRAAYIVLIGKSLEKKEKVLSLARHLSAMMKEILDETAELKDNVTGLMKMNDDINEKITETNNLSVGLDSILTFIENISTQTFLLGVNASVEAARAGAVGKGFGVISREIQGLAQSIKQSIDEINNSLTKMNASVNNVTNGIHNIKSIYQNQSDLFDKIARRIEELETDINTMETLAEQV